MMLVPSRKPDVTAAVDRWMFVFVVTQVE